MAAGPPPAGDASHKDGFSHSRARSRFVAASHGTTHCMLDGVGGYGDDANDGGDGGGRRGDESGGGGAGRLVVLVHGFMGSSAYYKYLSDALRATKPTDRAGAGMEAATASTASTTAPHPAPRVLRFDLYGRGCSSGAGGHAHDAALFAGQLAELLFALPARPPPPSHTNTTRRYHIDDHISLRF